MRAWDELIYFSLLCTMKYYIAYRFLGADMSQLQETLTRLSLAIETTGNQPYIYFRDAQNWWTTRLPTEQILPDAYSKLDQADGFFAFIESNEKSEWLLLEAWYAKAKNKKIVLAIKKDNNLRLLKSLADQIIEFETFWDLEEKIHAVL